MTNLVPGSIIQLDPKKHTHADGFWAARLCIVDEVKSWGVKCHARTDHGIAPYRAEAGTFEVVGVVAWTAESAP